MVYKFLIASTYDYIRNTCLCLLSNWMLYHYYLQCLCLDYYMSYLIYAAPVHPSLCLQCFNPTVYCNHYCCIYLLLLLFHRYYCYKTVATDNLCRASLFPGAAELTIHLSRLINILWLPLCRINKFGFYFPRRLLRSPILVGYQDYFLAPLPGSIALFVSSLVIYIAR